MKKIKNRSITIMVPAYNEEKYLATTVNMIQKIVEDLFTDYEILIFNDCSSDRTGEIADALAEKNPRIRVIHNKKNMGLGYNFRQGVKLAQKEYYCCIWADINTPHDSIEEILGYAGDADLITSYIKDEKRQMYRKVISRGFTSTLNLLFNLHLKYYCGIIVYKTELLKKVKMRTNSFAMHAEAIIQLIKRGYSHKECPYVTLAGEKIEESNMFQLRNIAGILKTITLLFFETHFNRPKKIKNKN